MLFRIENSVQVVVIFLAHLRDLLALGTRVKRGVGFDGPDIVYIGIDYRFHFCGLIVGKRDILAQTRQFRPLNRFRIDASFGRRRVLSRSLGRSRRDRGLGEGMNDAPLCRLDDLDRLFMMRGYTLERLRYDDELLRASWKAIERSRALFGRIEVDAGRRVTGSRHG